MWKPRVFISYSHKDDAAKHHLVLKPKDAKPIKDHRPHPVGWHDVSEGLFRVLEKLKKKHAGEHRSSERERGMR